MKDIISCIFHICLILKSRYLIGSVSLESALNMLGPLGPCLKEWNEYNSNQLNSKSLVFSLYEESKEQCKKVARKCHKTLLKFGDHGKDIA